MNLERANRLALLAATLVVAAPPSNSSPRFGDPAQPAIAAELRGGPPLAFVENAGQWDTSARFVAVMDESVIRVEERGFVVDARPADREERLLLRFDFVGSKDDTRPEGDELLPGVRNYFLGNDPERWRSGVRGYAGVRYADLYEGVELRLREARGLLEYDLCLAPGADVSQVVVRCDGADGLSIDEQGGLLMQSALGELRQTPPRTWCVLPSGEQEPLECEFVVLDEARFGFRLAEHDPELPVVIDPGLEWATYLGGSLNDTALGMVRKPNGEIVVTGLTFSADFPPNPPDTLGPGGDFDAFVSILDASGSTLLHSTLLGGSGQEISFDVQVNAAGEVFVAGSTKSADFPTTGDAYMRTFQGGTYDAWLAALSPNLSTLTYATYLGGTGNVDGALRLHVREPRVLTVGGFTNSTDLPATPGALQPAYGGGAVDYSLWRLDIDQPPATQLLYCTYLGGSGADGFAGASHPAPLQSLMLHEDSVGRVTLAGTTGSADFPTTPDGYDTTKDGGSDACLARIDPSQTGSGALLYGTFLGGDSDDVAKALAVDASGVVTLGGWTFSPDFPITEDAFEETYFGPAGYDDGFVLRLDPSISPPGGQLLYSTFLAGSGSDVVASVALDDAGRIVGQGSAGAGAGPGNVFPTTCGAHSESPTGGRDAFVFLLDPAGNGASDLLYSTFVGGPDYESLGDVIELASTTPTLKMVGAGWAEGVGFPTTPGAYQPSSGGFRDAILLQLEINPHSYCVAAANSASEDGALICGSGSLGITDNDFTLSATGAVPNQSGVFFYGPGQYQLPFGDGFRCVAPDGVGVFRFNPPLVIDGTGSASRPVDFTQPPAGSGAGQITAGSTWYFQFWYRDPAAGGAGHNLSNGLKATFYP